MKALPKITQLVNGRAELLTSSQYEEKKKNVSKVLISAQEMVVITEEVHAKCFEKPVQLNRSVEIVLFSSEGRC